MVGSCRVGYEELASSDGDGDSGGSAGSSGSGTSDAGQAGEGSGGTSASGGTGASGGTSASGGTGSSTGGSSTGGTIGEGGASGEATGGSSGAAGSGGTSGRGGTSGTGGGSGASGTGGGAGSGGCSPTNGGVEICDGVDNDCAGGADDGVTCPSTCRGLAYGGNGYMFCDAEPSYADADLSCTSLGMHLVKIDSAAENDFIASNMFGTNAAFIWLGGDDRAVEGTWRWHDGTLFWSGTSSGMAPSGIYTNWYPGYPGAAATTDCLEMRDDATWDDKQCTQGKRYVCELLY